MCHPDKSWKARKLSTGHGSFPPLFLYLFFQFPGLFVLKLLYLSLLVI